MPDHALNLTTEHTMTPEESAVSLAADEADIRYALGQHTGPGVWHHHFLDSLTEQGYTLSKKEN